MVLKRQGTFLLSVGHEGGRLCPLAPKCGAEALLEAVI